MQNLDSSPHATSQAPIIFFPFSKGSGSIGCCFTFRQRLVRSVYVFVNGFVTIGVLALLALVSRNPFVFPSLGPTAYLLFFTPLGRTSSPRNTVFGHAIGLICGYAAFVATGAGGTAIRSASGNFLAKNPGSGSFALSDRRVHGSSRREPSARRAPRR